MSWINSILFVGTQRNWTAWSRMLKHYWNTLSVLCSWHSAFLSAMHILCHYVNILVFCCSSLTKLQVIRFTAPDWETSLSPSWPSQPTYVRMHLLNLLMFCTHHINYETFEFLFFIFLLFYHLGNVGYFSYHPKERNEKEK